MNKNGAAKYVFPNSLLESQDNIKTAHQNFSNIISNYYFWMQINNRKHIISRIFSNTNQLCGFKVLSPPKTFNGGQWLNMGLSSKLQVLNKVKAWMRTMYARYLTILAFPPRNTCMYQKTSEMVTEYNFQ